MPIPNVATALGSRNGMRTDGRGWDTGDLRGFGTTVCAR